MQSVNATNSDSDRAALDLEVQQRLQEIDRIAQQTSFNGRNLLDGSFGSALFQVGANVGETIGLNLETSVRTSDVGSVSDVTSIDDLSTVIADAGTAASAVFDVSALFGTDFQAAADATSTVEVTAAADDADTFVIETTAGNVTFTFADATTGIGSAFVDNNNVTITRDITNSALDANTTAAAIDEGIQAYLDGGGTLLGAGTTVDSATDTVTITFDTLGDPSDFIDGLAFSETGTLETTADADATAGASDPVELVIGDPTDGEGPITVTVDSNLSAGGNTAATALLADINDALSGELTAAVSDAGVLTLTDLASGGEFSAGDITLTDTDNALGGGTASSVASTSSTTGVAGPETALELVLSDLTITFGDNEAITLIDTSTTFTTQQQLVDTLNAALGSNGTAVLDTENNNFSISSGVAVTIGGADAATVFSATSFAPQGSLDDVAVTTVESSNSAIRAIDSTLTTISDLRSTFGAIQNRFESTIANLATTSENLTASRSRIQDADFAAETAALTRAQILQQAGISVLAQANALPNQVLALLQ